MLEETAVFVINKKVAEDPVLQDIFEPNPVRVYPGVADGPIGEGVSYPYIRYFYVPVVSRRSMLVRTDTIQYVVGAKDLTLIARMIERLIYILNTPDYGMSDTFAAPDMTGR